MVRGCVGSFTKPKLLEFNKSDMKREDVIDRRWYRADGRAEPRRALVNIASINFVVIDMSSPLDLYEHLMYGLLFEL